MVPGKCDMPPLAMIATRSLRLLTISASALPNAAQRCGVGSGGTYTLVKNGMTGMSRLPMTNSNGTANAWPSSASSEYATSKFFLVTSCVRMSSAISRWFRRMISRPANRAVALLPAMMQNAGIQVGEKVST